MSGCITRVKIVDDLAGYATIAESRRERGDIYFALAKLVRNVNRGKEDALRASLHLMQDLITLHWHTPATSEFASRMNAELIAIGDPIREVERILWAEKGGVA
jgi:hypothetical protein